MTVAQPAARLAALAAALVLLWSAGAVSAQDLCPGDQGANFTAADCPNGSCFAGAPNGCGSRSVAVIAAEIVPEKWPAGVDFTNACNQHDTCYFTLGADREACNREFRDMMLAECEDSLKCIDVPLLGRQCTGDNPLLTACAALAEAYFQAVNSLGRESFERDQADQEAHAAACEQRAAGAAP